MPEYRVSNIRSHNKKLIVCMSSTNWNFLWQRPQQIMSRLSADYNILYVDPPFPVSEEESVKSVQDIRIIRQITPVSSSLKVLSPLINRMKDANQISSTGNNTGLLAAQIRKALQYLHWDSSPLLWIYNLPAVSLIGKLGELGTVYDCVDSFASFSWAHPKTSAWEKELLQKADIVLASAKKLYETCSERHHSVYLIPNAADFGHFAKCGSYEKNDPPDIRHIRHPRLGFIGAAYEWLDFNLLKQLAVDNPNWNLIMIGPQQHGIQVPTHHNIHWLGGREYKALPWYIQGLDLMIIPFLRNETTEHANPIKLWEYLAAGKPIISTRLPEIPEIPDVIWLSKDWLEFQENCQRALDLLNHPGKKSQLRIKAQSLARHNSWEGRCREIREIVGKRFGI